MTQLLLLCCAGTAAARTGAFAPAGEPLDDGGRRNAAALRLPGPRPDRAFASPATAARETATAAGLIATMEARLGDIDCGDWTGRPFAAVHAADPAAFAAWLAAPGAGAPGGETIAEAMRRMGSWLGEQSAAGGTVTAVTHPMIVRAALCVALDMPVPVAMRIDLPPLGLARLSFNRGWRLQALMPLA